MDLEHLNKHQVVLLALFVSFVTSIATGIVTVSLVNQAPPQVAATVNHIIERTIEQVAAPVAAVTSPSIKTVVVREDDLAAQSIANVQKSIVRIVASSSPDVLVARGIIIDTAGTLLTDRASLDPSSSYLALLPDGSRVPLSLSTATTTGPVLLAALSVASTTKFAPAVFADISKLALGQTVIRVGGVGGDTVGEGVIARLSPGKEGGVPPEAEATVSSSVPGSVLTTLFGEIIGMTTADSSLDGSDFYSILSPPSYGGSASPSQQKDAKK